MYTNIRKIDLNLLVALKALLDERNVSRAADKLALTQPTVSGMLARLRDLFEDPLFVRTRHGMLPTARAEALSPELDRVLRDIAGLLTAEEFDPAAAELDVRVSANDYMQSTVVIPFIGALRWSAPGIRVAVRNLEVTNLASMLARGELDLAISIPEFVESTLRTQLLYREEYVCAVRKAHPFKGRSVSMSRFLEFDHALVSPTDGRFHGPADVALAELGVERRVAISVPGFMVLLELLQSDDFIALVPRRLLAGREHALRLIRPPVDVAGFDVVAAWHPRSDTDTAHRWLREKLTTAGHFALK